MKRFFERVGCFTIGVIAIAIIASLFAQVDQTTPSKSDPIPAPPEFPENTDRLFKKSSICTMAELNNNKYMESLVFFESPVAEAVPSNVRAYRSEFKQEITKGIWWELSFSHPKITCTIRTEFVSILRGPSDFDEQQRFHPVILDPYSRNSIALGGHGFDETGDMPVGIYTIWIYINPDHVATGQFEISATS